MSADSKDQSISMNSDQEACVKGHDLSNNDVDVDTMNHPVAPLIHIPMNADLSKPPPIEVCEALVGALQNSGFLRIMTPLVPKDLQVRALEAATSFLESTSSEQSDQAKENVEVVTHPSDPKKYAMLTSKNECLAVSQVLSDYCDALETVKLIVLQCIAVGLDLDPNYFGRLHTENNSSLRLIRYPKVSSSITEQMKTGNRCKEHSDYGTITLLLTDEVSGLEAFHNGEWVSVPHEPGALVVNAGSLLEQWTNYQIPATLHRVAGPASKGTTTPAEHLMDAVRKDRTSIAFFADPNKDVSAAILNQNKINDDKQQKMSVADYIRWRSGGEDSDTKRSGLAFTEEEEKRIGIH